MIGISVAALSYFSRAPTGRRVMTLASKIDAAPGLSVISAMIAGAVIVALPMLILIPSAKEKKVCDQAVSTLFTTTDAIGYSVQCF